ncbi:hypothetical protein IAT38_006899 [Cryptococcus sp. DSM 104549]
MRPFPSALAPVLLLPALVQATHLQDKLLDKVYDVMEEISTHSWENGTKAQAILEYKYPTLSVFYNGALPLPSGLSDGQISEIIDVAQTTMNNRPATNTSLAAHGGSTLLQDDAAGDPASLGVTILLANASTGNAQVNGVGYGDAATAELNYLLYDVPRTSNGAISHRADQAQLWADSVYMVPPFLAYYGALHNNQTLLQLAYEQCNAYRNTLRQSSGLWYHIVGGTGTSDPHEWATGNAWAAAGMLRVWATISQTSFAGDMGTQLGDLQTWVEEILTAAEGHVSKNGVYYNYMLDDTSFEDASAAALMASVGLRLSTLNITSSHVTSSLSLLSAASSYVNSTGYLTQVVNPLDFTKQGTESPEGQSFLILGYAAHKDWDAAGRQGHTEDDGLGKNSQAGRSVGGVWGGVLAVTAGVAGLLVTL